MTPDPKKWRKAFRAHELYCDGLRNGKAFVDTNDPETQLQCHESGEPIEEWCDGCIGFESVSQLSNWEQVAENKGKTMAQVEEFLWLTPKADDLDQLSR